MKAESLLSSAWQKVQGVLGRHEFSPEEVLTNTATLDPHFIPRAPMSNANIDVGVLTMLGRHGMKRGKEITAQSHPELYRAWAAMSARAGMVPPQLILAESKIVNAMTLSPQEVVVTTGLLQALNLREVVAVLGHELGHGSSNHTKPRVLAYALLGGGGAIAGDQIAHRGGLGAWIDHSKPNPGFFRRMALRVLGDGTHSFSLLDSALHIAVGAWVGMVAANHIAVRPTELDADRKGAAISGDPEGLVSALTKLETHRGAMTFTKLARKLQSGYPSTETRIARLHAMAASNPQWVPVLMANAPTLAEAPVAPPSSDSLPRVQVNSIQPAARVGEAPEQAFAAPTPQRM